MFTTNNDPQDIEKALELRASFYEKSYATVFSIQTFIQKKDTRNILFQVSFYNIFD